MSARNGIIATVLTGLVAAGCAAEPKQPTPQATRAQTLIEQAEKAGAQQYAAADLERARDKLQAANAALEKGKEEIAQQYASEAAVDAELAAARTSSAEARKAAEEVKASTQTLGEEATRKSEPAPYSNPDQR
jgi:membrane-bound lytic murein transglycosylase